MTSSAVVPWRAAPAGLRRPARDCRRSAASAGGHSIRGLEAAAVMPSAKTPQEPENAPRASALPASARAQEAAPVDYPALVRRCLKGDSQAWAELVRSEHRRVYALCYHFTSSRQDAEDLTQEAFLKIHLHLRSFDPAKGGFPVWSATLTRNLLVDHFRRGRLQRATDSLDVGWEERESTAARNLPDRQPSPFEEATRKELQAMVQGALHKVSPELREAVILRDLQDYDYQEIGQILGVPQGTVKSRISRGRAELARILRRNQKQVM